MNFEVKKDLARKAVAKATSCRIRANVQQTAPLDPFFIAEHQGCDVWFVNVSSLEGMYSPTPRPSILIGSQRPAGRRSFTCAHELAHHLLGHGVRLEELKISQNENTKSPEEFLADSFAGYLLMPQLAVISTIRERTWSAATITADQAYSLASYFGVGYTTLITHFRWGLNIISDKKCEDLLNVTPKTIKANYGASPQQEVVFVDYFWKHCAATLEVGDILVLPHDVEVKDENLISNILRNKYYSIWQAQRPGYSKAFANKSEWAVNIRISRKYYEGLARCRFLLETEDDQL